MNTAPSDQPDVPQTIRERMRVDLDYDLRFYEHVLQVRARRRDARMAGEADAILAR